MELNKLIQNINIVKQINNLNPEILGVAFNSNDVKPGYVFVCLNGVKTSGKNYVINAMNK